MRSLALLIFGCFWSTGVFGQFTTINLNGTVGAGEYGTHTDGIHQQTSNGNTWYMTWDDTFLYLAVSGSFNPNNDAINLYLDVDPVIPVNGPNAADGSLTGEPYDQVQSELPFRADFFAFAKVSYNEFKTRDGAGGWGAGTTFSIPFGASANTAEFRIPWASITGAGRPASFNWLGYLSYDNAGANGAFSPVPAANPSVAGGGPLTTWCTHYYTVRNTDDGTTDQPFEWTSVAYREDNSAPTTGGYLLPAGTYMDITVNDNSTDNLDNINFNYQYDNAETCNRILLSSGTFPVYGDLYIGQGSGLFPADNTAGNVTATLEIHGDCEFRNRGRLDCVPELDLPGDELNRRLNVDVVDTLTIEFNNNLQVGFFRFGDLLVRNGALMRSSATTAGDVDIEFQMGTIDNNGTMQMTQPVGSNVDVFTRGFMPNQDNVVYMTSSAGTGVFNLNTLLIGTEVGYLRPINTAAPITINLTQNLEIYSNLICQDGTGELNFAFVGTGEQFIRGAVGETSEPVVTAIPTLPVEVQFHDITINNNNGQGNNNLNADVFFQSFNTAIYGNIDFLIAGDLELLSGDLVTRDRVTPGAANAVHELTLLEGGTVTTTGATSDIGGAPSSFVDGPFRREVASAALSAEVFPIGKSATFFGVEVGDYRRLVLEVDQTTAAPNVYVAEMFLGDQSGAYAWPAPVPEIIANISNIRYWSVDDTAGSTAFDQLRVDLSYGDDEYSDAVPNAPALRIVKDNGAGQWYNIQPLGVGGTASPNGEITSQDITGFPIAPFGDMTLANINGAFNPLDVGELFLDGDIMDGNIHLTIDGGEASYQQYQVLRSIPQVEAEQLLGSIDQPSMLENYLDQAARRGDNLYRIKGILEDGREVYSNSIQLTVTGGEDVYLDRGSKRLIRAQSEQIASVEVYDLGGKKVSEFDWPANQPELDLRSLSGEAEARYLIVYRAGATRKVLSW